ncbi:MAG: hypothetical protein ACHQZS_08635 [Candidatus Binatales bacterium]
MAVGIVGRQNLANLERQRRLADSAHPLQSGDRRAALPNRSHDLADFRFAANEIRRKRRKLRENVGRRRWNGVDINGGSAGFLFR